MRMTKGRLRWGAGAAAALVAAGLALPSPVQAESPLDFFRSQSRRALPERVESAPERVQTAPRAERRPGIFSRLFEVRPARRAEPRKRIARVPRAPKAPPVAQIAQVHQSFERVTCRRTCDGEEFALGILPKSGKHDDARAMCTAAGAGLPTELVVQDFIAGAGFTPVIAATPVQSGRASASIDAPALPAGQTCETLDVAKPELFMVPLLHDATLRRGDIVATPEGFKVFVGRGSPPFKASDFLDNEERLLPKDVRGLEIATR